MNNIDNINNLHIMNNADDAINNTGSLSNNDLNSSGIPNDVEDYQEQAININEDNNYNLNDNNHNEDINPQ